jgi:hypothetical protein
MYLYFPAPPVQPRMSSDQKELASPIDELRPAKQEFLEDTQKQFRFKGSHVTYRQGVVLVTKGPLNI